VPSLDAADKSSTPRYARMLPAGFFCLPPDMNIGNPVRREIRPPGSPRIVGSFRVTQKFGCTGVKGEPPHGDCHRFHRGIDVSDATCGKAVLAAHAGKVKFVGELGNGELVVILNHGAGWGTSYGHLSAKQVADGDEVTKGQKIGDIGSSGFAHGCHLQFAVKSGLPDGWGKADFIPNAFGGRGDKTGRWEDPWALLEQNAGAANSAAKEVPDVPIPSEYIPGQVATIRNNAEVNVRAAPKTAATVIRKIPAGNVETWIVTCWEKGELTSGSDRWLARWASGRWEYVHKINVAAGPATPAAGDCTAQVKLATDRLDARIAALKTKVASLAADLADD
jgi:hypothetical protein